MKNPVQKILVPTDFSRCADAAFQQAVALARRENAELHVVHALPSYEDNPYVPLQAGDWKQFFAQQEDRARGLLGDLIEKADCDDVAIVQHLPLASTLAPAILEVAERIEPQLIVIGAYGKRGFRRLFFGSTTQEVVRHASCPVMTVREGTEPAPAGWPRRVMVPVDLSESSRTALETARKVAGDETLFDLVHVVEMPTAQLRSGDREGVSPGEMVARAEQAVSRFVDQENRVGEDGSRTLRIHVLEGRPADSLAEHAAALETDLIVVATRGLSGLSHLLLGSVTERLLRLAECPVLTVRTETGPGVAAVIREGAADRLGAPSSDPSTL